MKLFPGVTAAAVVPAVAAVLAKKTLASKVSGIDATHDPVRDALLPPPEELVHHRVLHASDGAVVHYVDTRPDADPTMPTLVLCHGITAQWWCWSPIIRLLAETHRIVAWDMRGHGRSTSGADGVSIVAAARDLAQLLDELSLTRAVVAGHSMGGMELARFLVDHTDTAKARLQGALFLATSANSGTGTLRTGGWARNAPTMNRVSALGGDRQVVLNPANPLAVWFVATGYGPGATRAMINAQMAMQNDMSPISARQGMASIAVHNVESALRQRAEDLSSIDVVVMSASLDRLTPPLHGKGIVASLPHAAWEEVANVGHNLLIEQPETVADCLRKMLA